MCDNTSNYTALAVYQAIVHMVYADIELSLQSKLILPDMLPVEGIRRHRS